MLDFGIGALAISPVNMHVSSSCHSGAALYQLPERSRGDCLYAKAENLGSLAKTSAELAVPMHGDNATSATWPQHASFQI